jgi:hypothetical protein
MKHAEFHRTHPRIGLQDPWLLQPSDPHGLAEAPAGFERIAIFAMGGGLLGAG